LERGKGIPTSSSVPDDVKNISGSPATKYWEPTKALD
jgi:hypothetical protein